MTGVYPVFENKFKIGIKGRSSSDSEMAIVAEMESFSVSIDGNVEEWKPMEMEGWTRRMVTGKSLTIGLNGKRHVGDPGNDYVADRAWGTGATCESRFEWEFPSGAKLKFDCVISVTNPGGGDSTNVSGLEFEVLSDGKPEYVPAQADPVPDGPKDQEPDAPEDAE